jgi:transposase
MGYRTTVGLDVHARSIHAAALDISTGEITEKKFSYEPEELISWLLSLPHPLGVVYESGVTGFHLQRVLDAAGIECHVGAVSKMIVPAADRKKKTDKRDARFLARMLAVYNIVDVWVPDEECEAYRGLIRYRDDLKQNLTCTRQRLNHFLMFHGIIWNEKTKTGKLKSTWASDYKVWLSHISFEQPAAEDTFVGYLRDCRDLAAKLVSIDKRIAAYSMSERYKPFVEAFSLIKGISTLSAFSLATEADRFARFDTAEKFSSWIGLVPSEYSSGQKECRSSITKTGNRLLRRLLVECSWSYARQTLRPKACSDKTQVSEEIQKEVHKANLYLFCQRKKMKAKNKCVANVATARQLACQVWAIGRLVEDSLYRAV